MTDNKRQALVDASLALVRSGLNQGTAGNVSVRDGSEMLITPSGLPPDSTDAGMIASMPIDGDGAWAGPCKPSSEWRLHRDIYRHRTDVEAVVHTHSLYATVLATQHRTIPALHYMVAAFGDSVIRCTPYVPFGTQALSDLIVEHLGSRLQSGEVAAGIRLAHADAPDRVAANRARRHRPLFLVAELEQARGDDRVAGEVARPWDAAARQRLQPQGHCRRRGRVAVTRVWIRGGRHHEEA